MINDFNGKLEMEWIPVTEKLPLEEYDTNDIGMIAYVLVLIVDPDDFEDPTVVSLVYQSTAEPAETGWYWTAGNPYPESHAKNIRYWTYHPHYETKNILDYEEKIRPLQQFCEGKKPVDILDNI